MNCEEADGFEEEEECAPRKLLDTVDEQRSLIETLLSLGADQGAAVKKVSEIYRPPRVALEAQRRPALGISGLKAFDLSTAHPKGGCWNFNLKEHRELATRICEEDNPDWLIGSPPMYGLQCPGAMEPQEKQSRRRQEKTP